MAGGFQAGSIVGSLVLDKTKWTQSVAGVKKDTKAMGGMSDKMAAGFKKAGKVMTIAGGLIVGTLGTMVKKYVEVGDWVDKMSKRTGFAATTLSELAYAADISGASLTDVEKAVKRMAKTIIDAGDGLATYVRAFKRIGIAVEDLKGLNPEEQFLKIGEAIASVEDPTLRAAAAQDIFGRAGTTLLPLFAEGKEGLKALREEAHELGIVFDKEAAAKAAKLKDAQTALTASLKGLGFTLADSLVPVLTDFIGKITDIMKKVIAWVKENPKLTETIVKITGGIGALMLVLGPLAMMLPGLIAMFGALVSPIGLVVAALVLLAGAALEAKKEFKLSMELYQKEMELTGKKMSWFARTWSSLSNVIEKGTTGIDINKMALQAYNEEQRKAQGVMSIVTGTSKLLSGGVKFLGEKWQELADILPGAEKGTGGVNEKIIRTYEIAETAAQNIGILTSSMEDFKLVTVDTQTVLDNLKPVMTQVWEEAIPPARDFIDVIDQVPTKFEDMGDEIERVATEKISPIWAALSMDLSRSFGDAFEDILTEGSDFGDALDILFGGLVDSIRGFFGQMVTDFFANNVFSEMTSATATAAEGISGSMATIGEGISGVGTGLGALITSLATGIATAAEIIAASAPAILIAAGVALVIYAGFKLIASLFAKKAKPGSELDFLRQITENTFTIKDLLLGDYKTEIHTTQNLLRDIFNKVEAMCPKLDLTNRFLDAIEKNLGSSVSAQAGFYSPSLPNDTTIRAHRGETAYVGQQRLSISMNAGSTPVILKVDGRELALAVLKYFPELSQDGYVSMHNRASKDYG